jgi:diacylglycerol O-acyltransferase/trehalose O-mycolyltransferase
LAWKKPAQQKSAQQKSARTKLARKKTFAAVSATLGALLFGFVGVGQAAALPHPVGPSMRPGTFQVLTVPSSMGPIQVQVQWARRGGGAALYLLDGMRANTVFNAWSQPNLAIGGNAPGIFGGDNVTLVMPVGGESSFYTDWYSPSNFNSQAVTYKWETFLSSELPAYLGKFGVSPSDDGVVGLSMSGSSALALAAYHRNQFKFAGSFSGALDFGAPGTKTFLRLAMLDAGGYNIDCMWGPPWSEAWARNDPFEFAPLLAGLSMYISSGDATPELNDFEESPLDLVDATVLENLTDIQTHAFEIKLTSLGIPATYDYPWAGVHSWRYWSGELARSRPQILAALGV